MEIERNVGPKGQIVIPIDVRKKVGIKPGSDVVFEVEGNKVIIKTKLSPKDFVEDFGDIKRKLKKPLTIKEIKSTIDEEYEDRLNEIR